MKTGRDEVGREELQTFKRYKATVKYSPVVNVTMRGLFSLNQVAFETLNEPEAVELLYSPNGLIGFEAAPPSSPDAYRVRHPSKRAYQVEGRAFLRVNGIPEEMKERRYRAEMQDGVLTVDLNQGGEATRGAAKGRGA